MKNNIFFTLATTIFLMVNVNLSYSQIVYEHTYPFANSSIKNRLQLVDIGNVDFKYIYTDYSTNELKIFNMDHSPYLTILIPVPMIDEHEYVIGYITKSLFDCDTNMIEYAIMPVNWKKTFYINRQDGTILFSRDSTVAPYCFGCFSGSFNVQPIFNTPSGAKMFLAKCDTNGFQLTVDVFSLCGTLPMQSETIIDNSGSLIVFPNPNFHSQIYFQLRENVEFVSTQLNIYDSNSRLLKTVRFDNLTKQFVLDAQNYTGGIYFYRLFSNNQIIQSGKFIIN